MRIAPIDIAHKTFHRKMMGLDPDEVMEFLRMVAEELEASIKERNSLRETLREKDLAIAEYRERDELLKSTITTATRMSERMQVDAEREAKLILHDANQKAETIVRERGGDYCLYGKSVGKLRARRIAIPCRLYEKLLTQSCTVQIAMARSSISTELSFPAAGA